VRCVRIRELKAVLPCCNDHWLPGFNFNVEEWFEGHQYETLAICRSLSARMKLRHGLMVC
jgi:hypothetical protein